MKHNFPFCELFEWYDFNCSDLTRVNNKCFIIWLHYQVKVQRGSICSQCYDFDPLVYSFSVMVDIFPFTHEKFVIYLTL